MLIRKITTAVSLLKTPKKMLLPAGQNGLLNFVPDEIYLKVVFKAEMGYKLNLKHPVTYNEKLQWLKLYNRKEEYTLFADKLKVREYIGNTIGERYLIPLLGVYKNASDISWDELPKQFVLKCNHASGTNIICTNKEDFDRHKAITQLNSWMKRNAFWGGREWCYKNIIPCIICEEFIGREDGSTPDDYKIMCFNGEPKLIQVHHDRYGDHTLDFMDTNWNKTGIVQGVPNSNSRREIPKPDVLEEMINIARILSRNMPYVRIDLYIVDGMLKFGEITMYPTSGFCLFDNQETDKLLGSWITLPIEK